MLSIRIRFFAGHRDIVGQAELSLEVQDEATIGMVWEDLCVHYPRLAGYSGRILFAVNQQFATATTLLADGDEVAFIPPVSGGRS
ncbi:MAG: molybdopterin converting factor subunit 1 [Candidatus Viridilinea halotolerans]|uniref:Molybdopterin synthase sulfur carrier subunit n=1 Tax=Candidatus Viridilinea halotolerans TaxID=2491704 RepID=A0A426TQN3_9CHLR|nr:MAG: molybdopterin converting factor subunit 1 [Candidatus Viridilinea halotolerans]